MGPSVSAALDLAAIGSCAVALPLTAWHVLRPRTSIGQPPRPSLLVHPWTLFLATSILALANQIAFSAFLLAAHGGDAGFITRYTGGAYFHIDPDLPGVRALAQAVGPLGAERWLSPSLLRVNAFLELPFALFAYLALARLFDRAVPRLLCAPTFAWSAALSFSGVLSLIEVVLWNPWTIQDLVLRGVSCVVLAPVLMLLGRRERGAPCFPAPDGRPRGLGSLLVRLVGAAAIAAAILALYDLTLLYNMAHFREYAPALTVLLAIGTVAFPLAARVDHGMDRLLPKSLPSHAVAAAASVAASLSVLFFVPSLAIRYGLGHAIGRACGVGVLAIAIGGGLFQAARARSISLTRWGVGLAIGVLAGAVSVAIVHSMLPTHVMAELLLVTYALAFLAPMLLAWRTVELAPGGHR